jgi:hypothetical protein
VADINERLQQVAPDLAKDTLDSGAFIKSLEAGTPAIADYLSIVRAAALIDDRETIAELTLGLEQIATGYTTPRGFSGTYWPYQFDFWHEVGYELILGLVALLLTERRFETVGEILRTRLHIPNGPHGATDQVRIAYLNARSWSQQNAWGQARLGNGRQYISPVGELLKERYAKLPLANIVGWLDIQAADLFLALWSAGLPATEHTLSGEWIAHAAVLATEPPRFLTEAIRIGPARQVAQALGLPNPETLRDLYVDRVSKKIGEPFRGVYRLAGINFPNAHKIGSEP